MKSKLISIITPTYNHEKYIAECIKSVLFQSYPNWEMIIINDGSTDRTSSIAESFAKNDQRIHLIAQSNLGPGRLSETYNVALNNSKGDWIAILEGDDYWLPNKLEKQVRQLSDLLIFCYSAYLDDIDGKLDIGKRPPFQGIINVEKFIPFLLMHQSFLIAVTTLIKKSSLLSIGGFHQNGSPAAVDMATLMKLIELPGKILYIPEALGVWRHHNAQSTHTLGVEIAKFNAGLVFNYIKDLSSDELNTLKINKLAVLEKRKAVISASAFSTIRRKLQAKDREDFLPLIKDLWNYGNIKRKCEAIFCILAYLFHVNIEFPMHVAKFIKINK